jgi:D-mannonate dehydratase
MTIIKQYFERISFLHLRSSHQKIWDETLESGEEKNDEVVAYLIKKRYNGPWIIEIAEPARKYSSDHAERWIRSHNQLKKWIETAQKQS